MDGRRACERFQFQRGNSATLRVGSPCSSRPTKVPPETIGSWPAEYIPVAYSGLYIANRSCREHSNLSLQRRGLHGPFPLVYCTPNVRLFACPRVQKPGLAALGPLVTGMTARHPGPSSACPPSWASAPAMETWSRLKVPVTFPSSPSN